MKQIKSAKRKSIFISIIWPVLGLIVAIKNYNRFNADAVILGFCALFGFTFVISEEMDGQRYADELKVAYDEPFSSFIDHLFGLYTTSLDFVEPLITFIVSRFTDSHHILFAIFALIFGWFWLKSIRLVSEKFYFNVNKMSLLFTIFFISILPIFSINGFRMWTAAWVFIYGVLNILLNKDKRFFLFCFAACTIHFSFLTANAVLVLWMVLGNRKWSYLILAFVTLAISEIDLAAVRSYAELLGPAFEQKTKAYAGDEYAANVSEQKVATAWFITLSPILNKYLLLLNILVLFIISLKRKLPKEELNLLCFTLLFFSFSNVVGLVPSGGRFATVYFVFASILSIVLFSKYLHKRLDSLLGLFSIATISLSVLITFRVAAPTISTILFSPSILIPFGYDLDWSLMEWLF
jgi:hypothetical protein